jgi:hypothetical protein
MLVFDIMGTTYGDASLNGVFDSRDLVKLFQVGKYEQGVLATWDEGDFNGDGLFNSADLLLASQHAGYVRELVPARAAFAVTASAIAALEADRVHADPQPEISKRQAPRPLNVVDSISIGDVPVDVAVQTVFSSDKPLTLVDGLAESDELDEELLELLVD